ncbi:MAG TPA: ABC transporter ATP-binding protein [Baekduia sp.]|nr:ABC transporter ATP-binding protein [Baekduia sp.]
MGPTIYDLQSAGLGRSRRELPRSILAALRLIWTAGRRELITVVVLEACASLAVVGLVLVGRTLLSDVLEVDGAGTWSTLAPELVAVTALSTVMVVVQALVARQQQLLGELTTRDAQGRILDIAGTVELDAFDDHAFHDRIARAQAAVMRAPTIVQGALSLLQACAGALGGVIALAALQPVLLPVALLAVIPGALVSGRSAAAYYRFVYGFTPRDRERNYLARTLTERADAKEVRAMGLAGYLRRRQDELYDERIAELRAVTRRQLKLALLAGLTSSAIIAGALALLLALTIDGHITTADAAAAAAAMTLLGQRLANASRSSETLLEASMFVEDYFAFLALAPAAATGGGTAPLGTSEEIVAEDVWFTYPGAPAPTLTGVSVRVRPGEVVALVGANGCGKTTLAKLLAGLYLPDRGHVILHGDDTAAADRTALREQVGIVFQDFLRYDLPAYDNVALGRHARRADADGVVEATRRAGIEEHLAGLPDGLRTQLGPAFLGGVDLSLGQWQKVALARLFFRDAPFVILDEPTASLDARSEHDLFTRIRELFAGRSVLLISHRFVTVRDADRIYVLDGGRIAESGSHDELMDLDGQYAELFQLQASAYGEPQPAPQGTENAP